MTDFGVTYDSAELKEDGTPDYDLISEKSKNAKVAYIQRSRGYSLRPAFTVSDIEMMCAAVRKANPDAVIMGTTVTENSLKLLSRFRREPI